MTHVTGRDKKLEWWVVKKIGDLDYFNQLKFKSNSNPVGVYDFGGFLGGGLRCGLDVKVRHIKGDDFPDYFISAAKIEVLDKFIDYDFYIAYYFTKDEMIRVYDLRGCFLQEKEIVFYHRRAKKTMHQKVYAIAKGDMIAQIDI